MVLNLFRRDEISESLRKIILIFNKMLSLFKPKREEAFRVFLNELVNGNSSYISAMEWAFETRRGNISPLEIIEIMQSEIDKMPSRRGYPFIYLLDIFLKLGSTDFIDAVFTESFMSSLEKYITLEETSLKVNEFRGFEDNLAEYIGYSTKSVDQIICKKEEMEMILSCWNELLKHHKVYPVFKNLCNVLSFNLNLDVRKNVSEVMMTDYQPKKILEVPKWKLENNCFLCQKRLSFLGERHHCRNCGESVCDDCSKNRIPLPHYLMSIPQRVCDRCLVRVGTPIETNCDISSTTSPENMQYDKMLQKATELSLQAPQPPPRDSKKDEEEEELQLALTLSLSEHENKQNSRWQPKSRTPTSKFNINENNSMFPAVPNYSLVSEWKYENSQPNVMKSHFEDKKCEELFDRTQNYPEKEDRPSYQPSPSSGFRSNQGSKYQKPEFHGSESSNYLPESINRDTRSFSAKNPTSIEQTGLVESFSDCIETLENRIRSSKSVSRDQTISALMKFIWSQHPQFSKLIQENSNKIAEHEKVMKKFSLLSDVRMRLEQAKKQQQEYEDRMREEQALLHQLQTEEKLNMMRKQQKILRQHQEKLQSQLQQNAVNIIESAIPNITSSPFSEPVLYQQEIPFTTYPSTSRFTPQPDQFRRSQTTVIRQNSSDFSKSILAMQPSLQSRVANQQSVLPSTQDFISSPSNVRINHTPYMNPHISQQSLSQTIPTSRSEPIQPETISTRTISSQHYPDIPASSQQMNHPIIENTHFARMPISKERYAPQGTLHDTMIQHSQPRAPKNTPVLSSTVNQFAQSKKAVVSSEKRYEPVYVQSPQPIPLNVSQESYNDVGSLNTDTVDISPDCSIPYTDSTHPIPKVNAQTDYYDETSPPPPSLIFVKPKPEIYSEHSTEKIQNPLLNQSHHEVSFQPSKINDGIDSGEELKKSTEIDVVLDEELTCYTELPSAPMAHLVSTGNETSCILPSVPKQKFENSTESQHNDEDVEYIVSSSHETEKEFSAN